MTQEIVTLATQLLIAASMGLLGAVIRIYIQYRRDGTLPEDGLGLYTEAFLGVAAGFISWLFVSPPDLRAAAMVALTAGYSASDAIENWLAKK